MDKARAPSGFLSHIKRVPAPTPFSRSVALVLYSISNSIGPAIVAINAHQLHLIWRVSQENLMSSLLSHSSMAKSYGITFSFFIRFDVQKHPSIPASGECISLRFFVGFGDSGGPSSCSPASNAVSLAYSSETSFLIIGSLVVNPHSDMLCVKRLITSSGLCCSISSRRRRFIVVGSFI